MFSFGRAFFLALGPGCDRRVVLAVALIIFFATFFVSDGDGSDCSGGLLFFGTALLTDAVAVFFVFCSFGIIIIAAGSSDDVDPGTSVVFVWSVCTKVAFSCARFCLCSSIAARWLLVPSPPLVFLPVRFDGAVPPLLSVVEKKVLV